MNLRVPRATGIAGLSLVLAIQGIGPSVAPAIAEEYELEAELDQTEEQLANARAAMASLGDDISVATSDLESIDRQLSSMYGELAEREAELLAAEAEMALAESATAAAESEVAVVTQQLTAAEQKREASEQAFDDRIVALWKYGTVGYASAVLRSDDVNEAITQAYFVGRVLESDQNLVAKVRAAQDAITEQRSALDKARDQFVLAQSGVQEAVLAVAALTQVQRDLVDAVEVEQDRRKGVVDSLRLSESRYAASIRSLEAESDRITRELAASRYAAGRPGKGDFVWPTSGSPGSGYGYRTHPISGQRRLHAGIDIGAPTGQKIVSVTAGKVVSAGWRGGYGMAVVIDHGGGVATLYAHQSRVAVQAGEIVAKGQTIGYVGSTGYSTGPHLHFEVRVDGSPVDPMDWY